jgi:hypothetical protein
MPNLMGVRHAKHSETEQATDQCEVEDGRIFHVLLPFV